MTTFFGRLQYNWALCSPLGLRWGGHAVQEARATLASHQNGVEVPRHELQHAQTVMAVAAPQGTLAPAPCRPCGWGLATVPVMAFIVHNASRSGEAEPGAFPKTRGSDESPCRRKLHRPHAWHFFLFHVCSFGGVEGNW